MAGSGGGGRCASVNPDFKQLYPSLYPEPTHKSFVACAYCRGKFADNLVQCSHCGAPAESFGGYRMSALLKEKVNNMIKRGEQWQKAERITMLYVFPAIAAACLAAVMWLSGCSATINPDVNRLGDGGTYDSGGDPTADVGPDAGTDAAIASDAGATCAGLPLGDVTLAVTSTNCEGPMIAAQSFSGRVSGSVGMCAASGSLRVICNHMYETLPVVAGPLYRTGTTYTSEVTTVGCEGVEYLCRFTAEATTNVRYVECSLNGGRTWCQINLE